MGEKHTSSCRPHFSIILFWRNLMPSLLGGVQSPTTGTKKRRSRNRLLLFLIQAAGLAYHHRTTCGAYHQGRQAALASHHAPACILLRLDDIQPFGLMIYRRQAADDMQGCALIRLRASRFPRPAQRAVHIIKGGRPPLYLITRRRVFSCSLNLRKKCGIIMATTSK